jgi:predicted RNA-binding Zn-ribbon protein involved in translation (DUF1610 family)
VKIMAKCPHCGKQLDSLRAYSLEENVQIVTVEDGQVDWSTSDVVDDSCVQIEFECPECGKVIYKNKGDSTDAKIKQLLSP